MQRIKKIQKYLRGLCLFCIGCLLLASPAFANGKDNPSKSSIVRFERMELGQYTIEAYINGQGPFRFMIDTAASRTSIFEDTRRRLGIELTQNKEVLISGMTDSSFRPTIHVESLRFGRQNFANHKVVVLDKWYDPDEKIDGILGVEVFENLVLQFSHRRKQLKISKGGRYRRSKYKNWQKIDLIPNPYPVEDYGLLFTYTQIGDLLIPTMVDTGANFTTLNWASVKGTVIEGNKRRLREKWVIEGAVGEFIPRSKIRVDKAEIGGVKFKNWDMLVMDFGALPINGHGKYPLVITGVDLMAGQDFVFDFKNKILLIRPKTDFVNTRPSGSRILKSHRKYE